jgi:hypothetical protein
MYKITVSIDWELVAEHTGQSSQLFAVAPGGNAQFLPAVASLARVDVRGNVGIGFHA